MDNCDEVKLESWGDQQVGDSKEHGELDVLNKFNCPSFALQLSELKIQNQSHILLFITVFLSWLPFKVDGLQVA